MISKYKISPYVSEFVGTFFLVLFGCGTIILSELTPSFQSSIIPLVFGATVSTMIYSTGHISGAHMNPAVTLAFWSIKKFPMKMIPGYFLSQILGATSASLFHLYIWGSEHSFGATIPNISLSSAFFIEVTLSFALMFVVVGVATDTKATKEMTGIAIGSVVTLCAFFGGPLTGASMNPARTLGPAIISGNLESLWLYLTAPIAGTILAAICYYGTLRKEESEV